MGRAGNRRHALASVIERSRKGSCVALPVHLRVNALLDARWLHEHDQPARAAAIAERLGQAAQGETPGSVSGCEPQRSAPNEALWVSRRSWPR
jgi:hypothetical protein